MRRRLGVLFLVAAAIRGFAASPGPLTPEAARARIGALKAQRLKLQDELRSVISDGARLMDAPGGDVLIGLPTSLVESIVSEALAGPLRSVRLSLKNVVKAELSDEVRAKTLLGTMTLGRYSLTINVEEVNAVMKPKSATLVFGANRIVIDLPVSVEAGDVKAKLIFRWEGRKLAGIVCGDLTGEHDLRAAVPPVLVRLRGRFDVHAQGEKLQVRPVFAPIDMAFKVEPQQRTWDYIDGLIESKNAVCEAALRKAAVGQKVKDLVARGFKVRLPNNWLHTMTLPASFRDTVDVQGRTAGLAVIPTGVFVTRTRIWYGADLILKSQGPSALPSKRGRG